MPRQKAALHTTIYDHIEIALWACLAAGLALFAIFVAPGIPAAQQRNESERIANFERECDFYCTKWGLQHGTIRYSTCVSDLHQFRESLLKQVAAEEF